MDVKEMKYTSDRLIELLYNDIYKGYHYYVLNLGTHPTAYVEIPSKHPLFNVSYMELEDGKREIIVHGGLTYSRDYLQIGENTVVENSWFIGWDYAHWDDYNGYNLKYDFMMTSPGKKWATDEIIEECKNVIEQLQTYTKGGDK